MKLRLAFDHREILTAALERLRGKVEYTSLPAFLLPAEFTLSELQRAYEIEPGANWRRAPSAPTCWPQAWSSPQEKVAGAESAREDVSPAQRAYAGLFCAHLQPAWLMNRDASREGVSTP
jgi:hypothetical protein